MKPGTIFRYGDGGFRWEVDSTGGNAYNLKFGNSRPLTDFDPKQVKVVGHSPHFNADGSPKSAE